MGSHHSNIMLLKFLFVVFATLKLSVAFPQPQSMEGNIRMNSTEPDPNCPMVGLDCLFNDIERAGNSATWQECAIQCANHRTCAYWSWRVPSSDINPYGCWLKSGCPFTLPDDRLVSGAYTCTAKSSYNTESHKN